MCYHRQKMSKAGKLGRRGSSNRNKYQVVDTSGLSTDQFSVSASLEWPDSGEPCCGRIRIESAKLNFMLYIPQVLTSCSVFELRQFAAEILDDGGAENDARSPRDLMIYWSQSGGGSGDSQIKIETQNASNDVVFSESHYYGERSSFSFSIHRSIIARQLGTALLSLAQQIEAERALFS